MATTPLSINGLPVELFDDILSYLARFDLCNVARVSRRFYEPAVAYIYREVRLVDRHNPEVHDDHDDSDIIRILMTLCRKPLLASKVTELYYGCQIPPPDIFYFLPLESFMGRTLSQDPRLRKLLRVAISHMVNVQTLTITHGHFIVTKELIHGFFHHTRNYQTPVRRFWVESSCLEAIWSCFAQERSVEGLRSVRLRRMRIVAETPWPEGFEMSRGGGRLTYRSTPEMSMAVSRIADDVSELLEQAGEWDCTIYGKFPDIDDVVAEPIPASHVPDENGPWAGPVSVVRSLFKGSANTLTSLNLDWLEGLGSSLEDIFSDLPLFPNLKAFQVRNAVTEETEIGPHITLFEPESLFFHFLRNHRKIEYLAWPMENFFPPTEACLKDPRVAELISDLGRRLKFLRIDAHLTVREVRTDESNQTNRVLARISRRRVIEYFAPEMHRLEGLKVEGGVPKDEARELLRALNRCPLKKLVVLGFDFPLKDWWDDQPTATDSSRALQSKRPLSAQKFIPEYGKGPPLLRVIPWIYHDTIEELKFLGSHHVFFLNHEYPESTLSHILSPLSRFKRLRELTLAFSLQTDYQGFEMATEVAQFWIDSQTSASTALATTPQNRGDEAEEWSNYLHENFAPLNLAKRAVGIVGRYLYICQERSSSGSTTPPESSMNSPRILRPNVGVVNVRAHLRLNSALATEIFDLGVGIRPDQSIAWVSGPLSELQREPLKIRDWF